MVYIMTSISDLKNKIGEKIYCFGGGKAFDSFIKEFKLETRINAVVDNNINVIRMSSKVINNVDIPMISLDEMLNRIQNSDYILITTAAYEEVIEQLDKIEKLKNIRYFIYLFLRIEEYDNERLRIPLPLQLSTCNELKIPKTIHYCWFGGNKIPDLYRKWMESWRYFCPDYEIVEWNESNYDVNKNNYISQAYKEKEWAFVSDYARVDIINEYGGVYLDTDVELVKNIDELLMNESFCGFESKQYVNYGLGFGAKKNNSLLQEIKEYYDNINFLLGNGILDKTPCPIIQTEIMKKYGLTCNGKFQIVEGMAVYPSRVLCGMSPHSFRVGRNLIETYSIHHFEGSWVDNKGNKMKKISEMKKRSFNNNYVYLD